MPIQSPKLLFLLAVLPVLMQAQVFDDFSDGDFIEGTLWTGDADDFIVNGANRLQLNASEAGQSYLSTAFAETGLEQKEWRIWVQHTFAGSGNNFTRIYLSSMIDDLSFSGSTAAGASGYFLLLGEPGPDDAIRLFRDDEPGAAPVEIAAGSPGLVASSFSIRIRVIRDEAGNWSVFADPAGGDDFVLEATGFDDTYSVSNHLGLVCTYTVSNATGFRFDDVFFGDEVVDLEAPTVESLEVSGSDAIALLFSEPLDQSSAENVSNYFVDGGVGNPVSATLIDPLTVLLLFGAPLPGDVALVLTVEGVEDLAGNPSLSQELPFFIFETTPIVMDDFSDGDFTQNPPWSGSVDQFTVNENFELQLNAAAAGQSFLTTGFTPQNVGDREWRINVKHDFAGSGSNNTRVYLSSLTETLAHSGSSSAGAQGYFILLGEAGSDDAIRLFRDGPAGTSPVEVAAGTNGLIDQPIDLSLKVVRDAVGNWSLFADYSGGENYVFEGTGFDDTYTTAAYIGVLCNYTATNVNRFWFDEVYFGPIVPDTSPPELLNALATDANTLVLTFNEPLEQASAANVTNYSVSEGIGAPATAEVDAENAAMVTLSFSNPFPLNTLLTVTASGVADLSGNATEGTSANFFFIEPGIPQPGSVVINEMMVDPTPALGLPPHEFIELFNASEEVFELAGWELVNTTTARTLPPMALFPGDFVILCSSNHVADFDTYGTVIGIEGWVALTNSADSLTLISPEAGIIDIVSYNLSWYGDPLLSGGGLSLERMNPFKLCSGAGNWSAAQTFVGGTPGAVNSVFNDTPDVDPPGFVGVSFFGDNGVLIHFDEPLDPALVDGALDFVLTPDLGEPTLALVNNDETVRMVFDEPFQIAVEYQLTLIGIADCEGNALEDPLELALLKGAVPEPGDLIINEIMARPSANVASPAAEYVEVYNRGSQLVDLSEVRLENGTVSTSFLLPPNGYAVLTREADLGEFVEIETLVGISGFPQLTDAGRTIRLYAGENLLDEVSYTDKWYQDPTRAGGGYSLERINPDHPCSDEDNWRASMAEDGHTAGAINSVYSTEPDTRLPGIRFASVTDGVLLDVYFDKQLDPLSAMTLTAEVGSLTNGVFNSLNYALLEATMADASNRVMRLQFSGGFSAGLLYAVRIGGVVDCWGNEVLDSAPVQSRFAVPEEAQPEDILINEILFNPSAGGGTDYVEVYNNSPRNISMQNWRLANEPNGVISNERTVTELPLMLYPGEYFVFTESRFGVVPFYPGAREDRIIEMERLPAYNNGDGVVVLLTDDGTLSDRIAYDESMHYPLLRDVKGVSLERLDFNRPTGDLTNWQSASEQVGFGTPGYENSQVSVGITEGVLNISPEVFSPDNDGFDDVCNISYALPRDGFTGSIRIFDDLGRPVRRVLHNHLLGVEGAVSWDGFSDDRLKAGIGMYIVYFEAFHPDGEVIAEKGVAVLGHLLD